MPKPAPEGETKALTISERAMPTMVVGGFHFKVKQEVTIPTLKQETGETVLVQFTHKFVSETKQVEKTVTVNGIKQLATEDVTLHIARVRELVSGAAFTYVLNAITYDNVVGAYPDDSYVGKYFAITKGAVVDGKRYKDMTVVEIEPEAAAVEVTAEVTKVE